MNRISALILGILMAGCAGGEETRIPSASPQVYVPQDSVFISGLDRHRKIRLYLPKGYDTTQKSYPVLYMHDGQNLFDDVTSYVGEWGVDEILDSLQARGLELIIVGIDNGGEHRMQEYSPWDHDDFGPGEGREYTEFIVNELKPAIDSAYRTLPGREHTGIMGSSMGGLISHYAGLEYSGTFGLVGIFSPSYWYSDEVWEHLGSVTPEELRIYMLAGEKEGRGMVTGMEKMAEEFLARGLRKDQLRAEVDPDGEHNERFWRAWFAGSIQFLYGSQ